MDLQHVSIKPLSVNKAWQGKRFKSQDYKDYQDIILLKLPKIKIPEGDLRLDIEFGYSNKAADIDNGLKPFIDCLQLRYGFNDKNIYELNVKKKITKKKEEYIKFIFYEI